MREIFVTFICLGFAGYMAYVVFEGLRTGRVGHTDSTSYCARSQNPLG
jgi:hypothetical protein